MSRHLQTMMGHQTLGNSIFFRNLPTHTYYNIHSNSMHMDRNHKVDTKLPWNFYFNLSRFLYAFGRHHANIHEILIMSVLGKSERKMFSILYFTMMTPFTNCKNLNAVLLQLGKLLSWRHTLKIFWKSWLFHKEEDTSPVFISPQIWNVSRRLKSESKSVPTTGGKWGLKVSQ